MRQVTGVEDFEDRRWGSQDQVPMWRHRAALQLISDEPVLDIGGGDGLLLSLLRGRNCRDLTLMDISSVAVEKARAKGFKAQIGDVTKAFPFDDKTFGTACALDVLEHLYEPAAALREMARVAKSIVIVVPNFHYWKDRARVCAGRVPFSCRPRRGHVYWFNYATLSSLVCHEGMGIDRMLLGAFKAWSPAGRWLARARPELFAHSFAVKIDTADWTAVHPPPASDLNPKFDRTRVEAML